MIPKKLSAVISFENIGLTFANNLVFWSSLQIILVVESVSAMLNHDRKLRKLSLPELQAGKT